MKKILCTIIVVMLGAHLCFAANVTVPQSTAYGQVLIGNAAGGNYTPVATSTLGISGGVGSNFWTLVNSILYPNAGSIVGVPVIQATSTSGLNYLLSNTAIGTTSSRFPLDIASSTSNTLGGAGQLVLTDTNADLNLKHELFTYESGNLYIGNLSDVYATSTAPSITVTKAGNFGFNSPTPVGGMDIAVGTMRLVVASEAGVGTRGLNFQANAAGGGNMIINSVTNNSLLIEDTPTTSGVTDEQIVMNPFGGMSFNTSVSPAGVSTRMTITQNGPIVIFKPTAIGTTSAPWWFDVAADSSQAAFDNGQFVLTDTNAGANLKHFQETYESGNYYMGQVTDLLASTSPYLTILNGGNTGISTSSPSQILSVQGNGLFSGNISAANITATGTVTDTGISTSTFSGIIQATCFTYDNNTCLSNSYASASAYKQASNYATTAALPTNTYNNGSSGVGATLTEVGTGALSVDGASPVVGNRILVKNEATGANNGIYTVTVAGSGIAAYVLTRSTDFNSPADVFPGVATYILGGTANIDDVWALSNTSAITIGSTALTFAEITSTPLITSVSNSDGSLTVTPTTGAVVASINAAHANNFTATQSFTNASSTQTTFQGPVYDNTNSPGTSGQVFTSQGANTAPHWAASGGGSSAIAGYSSSTPPNGSVGYTISVVIPANKTVMVWAAGAKTTGAVGSLALDYRWITGATNSSTTLMAFGGTGAAVSPVFGIFTSTSTSNTAYLEVQDMGGGNSLTGGAEIMWNYF